MGSLSRHDSSACPPQLRMPANPMCVFCIPVFVPWLALYAVFLTPTISLCLCQFRSPAQRTRRFYSPSLFQVPYPVSPLLATLTKTAGVYTNNSCSGSNRLQQRRGALHSSQALTTVFKFVLFTLLRTLLHSPKLNSFIFNRFRTLCQKTPGVGGMDVEEISPLQGQIHGKKLWDGRRVRGKGMSRRTDEAHSLKAVPQKQEEEAR